MFFSEIKKSKRFFYDCYTRIMEGQEIFKSEEEIAEYFNTIGVEYKFNCLYEKDPEGCTLLGDFYEAVEKNFSKAFETYKFGCEELSYAKSCNKLGIYYYFGKGVGKNKAQALKFWEKGCFEGKGRDYGISCMSAGQILIDEKKAKEANVELNVTKGVQMLERGCNNRISESCSLASEYFYEKKLNEKAFDMTQKGCDLNNIECCHNLYYMLKNGIGKTSDPQSAEQFKKKAETLLKQMHEEGIAFGT